MARVCLLFDATDPRRFHACILNCLDKTPKVVEPLGTLRYFDRSTRSVPTRPDPRRFCFFFFAKIPWIQKVDLNWMLQ